MSRGPIWIVHRTWLVVGVILNHFRGILHLKTEVWNVRNQPKLQLVALLHKGFKITTHISKSVNRMPFGSRSTFFFCRQRHDLFHARRGARTCQSLRFSSTRVLKQCEMRRLHATLGITFSAHCSRDRIQITGLRTSTNLYPSVL